MLSKKQFDLALNLLNNVLSTDDVDDYLKSVIEILYAELNPHSIAVYIPIEQEEKLVLIKKLGSDFDRLIDGIYNFSLMVRKAIKKKVVLLIPPNENDADEAGTMVILIPLIGQEVHIGLIGMVFDAGEMAKQRAVINFYQFLSKIIGFGGYLKKEVDIHNKITVNQEEMYSEKIRSLGVLSAGVAHEFNNIFAVIKGYAELIEMNSEGQPEIQYVVKQIDEQTERASGIIESLHVFLDRNNVKLAYNLLNSIIREVLLMHQSTFEKEHISLISDMKKIPRVLIDRDRIREALLNVIQNAIHSVEQVDERSITIKTFVKDDEVVLTVGDNGSGMTQQQIDMVINPYMNAGMRAKENTDDESSGAALRLAIAHGIMENHGGRLEIKNYGERGKEVRLIFKLTELGEETSSKYDEYDFLFIGDTKILVVDDEEHIREILTRAFEGMGYQVVAVANGEEAIEISSFEDIDIVFLDYLMPGPKGDKVFDSLKRLCPMTDIVLITGVEEIPNIEKMLSNGLTTVLKKPFKIEKIIKITKDIIYRRITKRA